MKKIYVLILAVTCLIAVSPGCTKVITQESPDPVISQAKKMIEDAKLEKADIFAPEYLNLAEKGVLRALESIQKGNNKMAIGFAKRSLADAEMALYAAKDLRLKGELLEMKKQLNSN